MTAVYLLLFILADLLILILIFIHYLFGKKGILSMYFLHIILSQIAINIPIEIFGYTAVIGSGLYAVLFLTMDMMNEHYGKKEADKCIYVGVSILISFLAIITFIRLIIGKNQDAYSLAFLKLFDNQPRIIITDIIISYFVFQKLNVFIYDYIRKITKEKHLWLRNNVSTIISQILTAIFFYEIAFVGVIPQNVLIEIIITGLAIKLIVSVIETPFLYLSKKISVIKKDYVNK